MALLSGQIKLESYITLNGLLVLGLAFGYYFKRNTSNTICFFTKCCCIALYVLITVIHLKLQNLSSRKIQVADLYFFSLLMEISINVLVSLITEEKYLIKFSSYIGSNTLTTLTRIHCSCFLSYFTISIAISLKFVIFLCFGFHGFPALAYFIVNYQNLSCLYCRISLIYITDNYRKTIHVICKSLKKHFENAQMNDAEKTKHVKYFISAYAKLLKNFNSTITIMRLKVSKGCTAPISI